MNQATPVTEQTGIFRRSGVRFEVACDVIGAVIAHFASVVGTERSGTTPDTTKIARTEELMTELRNIREALDPANATGIEAAIQRLAPLARIMYDGTREGTQKARRAVQSGPTNPSLALADLPPTIDDLAMQAQIIRGTMSLEQAVEWCERQASS